MDFRTRFSAKQIVSGQRFGRAFALALLFTALLVGAGCGGKGAKDVVSGKVTYDGKPISMGEVIFQLGDKEARGPIVNGQYTVENPPKGEVSILVKSPNPGGGQKVPDQPGEVKGGAGLQTAGAPVYAPAKYGEPNNGLKFTVTGGKQTHDITLTP